MRILRMVIRMTRWTVWTERRFPWSGAVSDVPCARRTGTRSRAADGASNMCPFSLVCITCGRVERPLSRYPESLSVSPGSLFRLFVLKHEHRRQFAEVLFVIQAVADDKLVVDGESHVFGVDGDVTAGGFIEEGAQSSEWVASRSGQGEMGVIAGVENVFDDEECFPAGPSSGKNVTFTRRLERVP